MADLCTLAEAKTHLNIPTGTTTHDVELAVFITVASDLVEEKADRIWRDTTYTEYHDGGTCDIVTLHSPVKTLTSVTDFGSVVDSANYVLTAATGRIHLLYGTFTGGESQVVVVYTAGVATVPAVVKQATLETLRHLWQTQRGSMGSRNPLSGDDYASGSAFTLPNRVIELIDRLSNHNGIG